VVPHILTAEKEGSTVVSFIKTYSVEHKAHALSTHMHFEYHITPDEFVASQLLCYKLKLGSKRISNAFGLIMIFGIAWGKKASDSDSILLGIMGAFFIYIGIDYYFPARRFRRAYQKSETVGKRFQADINKDGFEVTGDVRSWRVQWEGVQLKGENERVFILYSAGTLFMFGKKYLNNEQQMELRTLSGLTTHGEPRSEKSSYW
jgi:hypothetical protein